MVCAKGLLLQIIELKVVQPRAADVLVSYQPVIDVRAKSESLTSRRIEK